MLHLVRHADAGDRLAWRGDDFLRPLDDHGLRQAEAIAATLATRPVKRVLSSPAVRCVDTVSPLADLLGLAVEAHDALAEGTHPAAAFELAMSLASDEGDAVLCSHGDVIPGMLWAFTRYGADIPDRNRCKKASIWELNLNNTGLVSATYRHPSTFNAS